VEVDVEQPLLDIAKILAALPHRYPFLLVDRVVSLVKGESIHAYKNVTVNEEFFLGHFPGMPVMPGVLQLEAMAQAGGLLAHESRPFDPTNQVIYLMAFDKVKFRRVVIPGDRLDLHVRVERQKGSIWRLAGEAKVDGQVASEAEMMATIAARRGSP
jgi:3-hydroxyacyl-[acyl-carrier-protein] dehydratase